MNISDNSYYELLNRLRYFADNHYLINSFTHGQEAELDISKRTLFPTMHVVPPVITRSNGNKLFAFEIIFADLPRMKEDKVENQMEVISDCDRIADDLVNEIKNGNTVFGRMVDLVGDAVTEPFTEDYANVLTGVTLRVTLAVPYTFNACDIPANWNSNDPTEPVFGSRELTMNIYDEGDFIVAAREMNFVGIGVTVTHDANRAIVTITGGDGGGGLTCEDLPNCDEIKAINTAIDDANAAIEAEASARASADSLLATGITNEATARQNADNYLQTQIDGKENSITAGTTSQYWRGDKSWQTLDKSAVGLGNVDNTSDADKPISTAQQSALDAKQDTLVSGTNIKTVNGSSLLGSGDITLSATMYDTLRIGTTIPLSSVRYAVFGFVGVNVLPMVNLCQKRMHTNFRVFIAGTQPASGSLVIERVFTEYDGTVVHTDTLTIPAGSAAGVYDFTSDTFDASAGYGLRFIITNNATGASATINGIENSYQ